MQEKQIGQEEQIEQEEQIGQEEEIREALDAHWHVSASGDVNAR